MYNNYPCEYLKNMAMYRGYNAYRCPYLKQSSDRYIPFDHELEKDPNFNFLRASNEQNIKELKDHGSEPFVVNIDDATERNNNFRTAIWTGKHLQVTLMSINPGDDIGLEVHPNVDQFLRIEEGQGTVKMGKSKHNLDFERRVYDGYAIMVPSGTWHNVINTGNKSLKLYSIYAPPEHPYGTIHITKQDAEAAEKS
ncbi:cupin domain-containing protein [Clostridium fermenticellae]|uniref:Cupin domain-containing protein n=1 Tax=Clostridium fermenticellae TaxID=2068654 RepID=A0A386H4P7_9CLOT|nr:cupin domain-containing protein [Clostridium fermenticellae]AYD40503.1 cupin domain-containing protein [Clostridium fermenticellae]